MPNILKVDGASHVAYRRTAPRFASYWFPINRLANLFSEARCGWKWENKSSEGYTTPTDGSELRGTWFAGLLTPPPARSLDYKKVKYENCPEYWGGGKIRKLPVRFIQREINPETFFTIPIRSSGQQGSLQKVFFRAGPIHGGH